MILCGKKFPQKGIRVCSVLSVDPKTLPAGLFNHGFHEQHGYLSTALASRLIRDNQWNPWSWKSGWRASVPPCSPAQRVVKIAVEQQANARPHTQNNAAVANHPRLMNAAPVKNSAGKPVFIENQLILGGYSRIIGA